MLNNFIYAQTKDLFLEKLDAGEVLDEAIVFIEDTKEIWTHGTYFDCSTFDPDIIADIQTEIDILKKKADEAASMIPITYAELKSLRDNGELTPGMQYRITDYITTTSQENTQSAGHQFDIIVTADSENTLNEKARAIYHKDDSYFSSMGVDMNAWEIWYCLDNDTERFGWAGGTDVIGYFMIGNDLIAAKRNYKYPPFTTPCKQFTFYPIEPVDADAYNCYYVSKNIIDDETRLVHVDIQEMYDRVGTIGSITRNENGEVNYRDYALETTYIINESSKCVINEECYYYLMHEGASSHYLYIKENSLSDINDNSEVYGIWDANSESDYIIDYILLGHTEEVQLGKGVIYRMIDEFNNDCPYDFKNIKFYHDSLGTNVYTFTWIDENYNVMDTSVFGNNGTLTYYGQIYGVHGNVIKPYVKLIIDEYSGEYFGTKQSLNNIIFISDYEYEGMGNDGFCGCRSNSFGNNCYNNSLGNGCRSNSFGNDCYNNSLDNICNYNSFGNNCYNNSFGNGCWSNSFGNDCNYNSFGNDCYYNSFSNSCYSNSFGDTCYSNSFGDSCRSNIFGNEFQSNSFENDCLSNSFGNDCKSNSFGNNCYSNSFGNDCKSNSFGNDCNYNSFINECYYNSFGNNCYNNSFGNDCKRNRFGNYCDSHIFGDTCYSNSFGNDCKSNSFGNDCKRNRFGNDCKRNRFGNDCESNSFGNSCRFNSFRLSSSDTATLLDYCQCNHFDDGCSDNVIWNDVQPTSSNKLQNINVVRGVSGTESSCNFINIVEKNAAYEIKVAKNSSGEIKIYCEADLIA